MSDNSSIISGVESDQEKKQISQKYLSQNKSEKIKALVEEKQNWGKNKEKYYKGDAESGDSEAEIEEEMEARALQTKAAQKMQDNDFWDVQINEQDEEQIEQKPSLTYSEPALVSLSIELGVEPEVLEKMDIKELNAAILRGWPEIKGILKEVDNVSKEIKGLKKSIIKEKEAELKRYFKIRVQLLESYLALLFFYFQLRAKTRLSQHHPIFKKISDLKDQIQDSENYEKYAQLIHMHHSQTAKEVNEVQQSQIEEPRENTLTLKRKLKTIYNKEDINEKKINKIKRLLDEVDEKHLSKTKKIENAEDDEDSKISMDQEDMIDAMNHNEDNIEEGIDDVYQQNLDRIKEKKKEKKTQKRQEKLENFTKLNQLQKLHEVGEDDPRKITYVMLKNISLMRRRRGNRIKNSRIKHKERYQKALYKLKSQNKYLKAPQVGSYTGEAGIKSGLVKGVRLQ